MVRQDAEGAEKYIFSKEFANTLYKVKNIALEWHLTNCRELVGFLESIGFSAPLPWNSDFPGGMLLAKNTFFN